MKRHIPRALLCALLALALLLPAQAESFVDRLFGTEEREEAGAPQQTPAPEVVEGELNEIPESKLKDDGIVRVLIKAVGNPTSLTLDLDGVYTLDDNDARRFERGTRIYISDGGDGLYLTVGGFSMDVGDSVRLTRHYAEGENGIYIGESGYNALYPGDLYLSRNKDGGVRCVMHAPVEEYLRGVIAYEMGDSWPLEALKAQAVAARTYVMRRKQASKKRDYDVTDNTGDQVFKGVDPGYRNVTAAVRATEGVVGTYKGGFATCYYTASNGGETALPQDAMGLSGDYGYLARAVDPYDLENPLSMVKRYEFDYDLEGAPELRALLEDALPAAAQAAGLDPETVILEEIAGVICADPVAEDSKMYRKLRFDVVVSAPKQVYRPGADDIGAVVPPTGMKDNDFILGTVDGLRRLVSDSAYELSEERDILAAPLGIYLDVYDDIKRGLGLKLSSSDCELISVTGDAFGYALEMRRYGHGVGMSQRGAQIMAKEAAWRDILAFYYPGMALERMAWSAEAPSVLEPARFSTVSEPVATPTPGPLPELKKTESYATVVLGDAGSTLNMRAAATTESEVVITLANGQRLIVCGVADKDGWIAVRTAEASGFVREEYLKKE